MDSTAALEICQVLKDLARVSSLTVAMVIHQPRVEIWNQLDELLLLAPGGLTVYQGPQKLAVDYFASRFDVHMAPHENPADALMDRIAEQGHEFVEGWKNGGPAYVAQLRADRHRDSPELAPIIVPDEEEATSGSKPGAYSPLLPNAVGSGSAAVVDSAYASADSSSRNHTIHISPSKEATSPVQKLSKVLASHPSSAPVHPPAFSSEQPLRVTASFLRQLQLAFIRSMWKQAANVNSLVLEAGLGMLAGLVMGALIKMTYIGILISPYSECLTRARTAALARVAWLRRASGGI